MKHKLGILSMICGTLLILGAMALFFWNQYEDREAGRITQDTMPLLQKQIAQNSPADLQYIENIPEELLTEEELEMAEIVINGHRYIGYLSIPELGLELPVMSDWSYPQLKIAPCRFSGTLRGKDLVIMAHNYQSHFGHLAQLREGSQILFTDANGEQVSYEVVTVDLLAPTEVEEMTAGEYALTLFTCTPGRANRITIRCDMV